MGAMRIHMVLNMELVTITIRAVWRNLFSSQELFSTPTHSFIWNTEGKKGQRGNLVIYIMFFRAICAAQQFSPVNEQSKSAIDPKCTQHHHKWAAIHCPTNSILALKNRRHIVSKLQLLTNTTYWTISDFWFGFGLKINK